MRKLIAVFVASTALLSTVAMASGNVDYAAYPKWARHAFSYESTGQ